MTIPEVYFSKELFITALSFAVLAMLYTFGKQIITDARQVPPVPESTIGSSEIGRYFMEKGFIVCSINRVKDTNKWLVFLIRNGEYELATVFTKGDSIEGHQYSLV